MIELEEFRALLTPAGQAALDEAVTRQPRERDFLAHYQALQRKYPPSFARAGLEVAILRQEARDKFPFADRLYFNRQALEQASSYEVAAYRAQRFLGYSNLADLGCSVGGDTLAMAVIAPTIGIDIDPLRLAMAQANLASLGLGERAAFVLADLTSPLPLAALPTPERLGLFFDPARRSKGRRIFSVEAYHPPLSSIQNWQKRFPAIGVKLSPGVNLAELAGYSAEVEFISLRGGLKEAVMWCGSLKSCGRRATLLPGAYTLSVDSDVSVPKLPIDQPQAYIYEPDPAVLRAGLVGCLGEQLGATQMDADIAYLSSEHLIFSPFARAWAVEDWFPFGLKNLRSYLQARQVGTVIVKKRGSPLEPEELIRLLRLRGDAQRTIFLTHLRGKAIVLITQEV